MRYAYTNDRSSQAERRLTYIDKLNEGIPQNLLLLEGSVWNGYRARLFVWIMFARWQHEYVLQWQVGSDLADDRCDIWTVLELEYLWLNLRMTNKKHRRNFPSQYGSALLRTSSVRSSHRDRRSRYSRLLHDRGLYCGRPIRRRLLGGLRQYLPPPVYIACRIFIADRAGVVGRAVVYQNDF